MAYDKAIHSARDIDSAHVDALWEYSSEYESRLVSFFTNSLEFKS